MKDPLVGLILLIVIGLTIFDRPIDALMFACSSIALGFVVMEMGVWLGVVARK